MTGGCRSYESYPQSKKKNKQKIESAKNHLRKKWKMENPLRNCAKQVLCPYLDRQFRCLVIEFAYRPWFIAVHESMASKRFKDASYLFFCSICWQGSNGRYFVGSLFYFNANQDILLFLLPTGQLWCLQHIFNRIFKPFVGLDASSGRRVTSLSYFEAKILTLSRFCSKWWANLKNKIAWNAAHR